MSLIPELLPSVFNEQDPNYAPKQKKSEKSAEKK
jgi:hypothetical protein